MRLRKYFEVALGNLRGNHYEFQILHILTSQLPFTCPQKWKHRNNS